MFSSSVPVIYYLEQDFQDFSNHNKLQYLKDREVTKGIFILPYFLDPLGQVEVHVRLYVVVIL